MNFSSDLLVTFFTLLALWAATHFRPESIKVALAMGAIGTFCAFAAVTCKESGIAVVPALVVYWFLFRRREPMALWLAFFSAATVAALAFLAARFLLALPNPYHMSYLGGSFAQFLWIQPQIWVFMLGKIVWPLGLSADYSLANATGVATPLALLILGIVVALQFGLAWKSRLGALGVILFWLGLATVSNFIPIFRPMADRYYYLPMAGVAMQLVSVFVLLLEARRGFSIAMIPRRARVSAAHTSLRGAATGLRR